MARQLRFGPALDALLDRLYAEDASQQESMASYFSQRAAEGSLDWDHFDERTEQFLSDKLVALERTKAEFCYQLCRGLRARRIVEAGTSFGVSTLVLAAAVRDNGGGVVFGTEHDASKAARARRHFADAGLVELIDLREGDLRRTLPDIDGPIDFVLIDIWTPMACPALTLVAPKLRPGAVVVCDNTAQFRDAYAEYFAFVNDRRNNFTTMTLPFEGGLELTVFTPPADHAGRGR